LIDLLAPVWSACRYEYKLREVRQLLRLKAGDLIEGDREYLRTHRKNDSRAGYVKTNIQRLEGLAS
jgi:hypothetical protein